MEASEKEIAEKMQNRVLENLHCLAVIWNEIGIGTDSRILRLETVDGHLTSLLDTMVNEEKRNLTKLQDTITELTRELNELCLSLDLPVFKQVPNLSLLQLKENLQMKVLELLKEKNDRICRLKELCYVECNLCERLGTAQQIFLTESVPTVKHLESFQLHVKSLETQLKEKEKILEETKQGILVLLKELEIAPVTQLEQDLVGKDEATLVLSDVNMKYLKDYFQKLSSLKSDAMYIADNLKEEIGTVWDQLCVAQVHKDTFLTTYSDCHPKTIQALKEELERCRQLRIANLRRLTEEAREALKNLWQLCYFSTSEMEKFRPYYEDNFSEDNLHLIDLEISRLRQLYERKKDLFDKIKHREQLWLSFLELENASTDPNRFNNRGGNLLKQERERSRLTKELPKIEKQIIDEIKGWELTSKSTFLVEEMSFEDYVKRQRDNYKAEKDAEKVQRHLQKAQQIEKESRFGSKTVGSPSKRPLLLSHTSTAVAPKLRRMNEIHGTPSRVKCTPSNGLSCMSSYSLMHSKVMPQSHQQGSTMGSTVLSKGPVTPSKRDIPGSHFKHPNTSTPKKLPQTPSRWQTPSKPVFHLLL